MLNFVESALYEISHVVKSNFISNHHRSFGSELIHKSSKSLLSFFKPKAFSELRFLRFSDWFATFPCVHYDILNF